MALPAASIACWTNPPSHTYHSCWLPSACEGTPLGQCAANPHLQQKFQTLVSTPPHPHAGLLVAEVSLRLMQQRGAGSVSMISMASTTLGPAAAAATSAAYVFLHYALLVSMRGVCCHAFCHGSAPDYSRDFRRAAAAAAAASAFVMTRVQILVPSNASDNHTCSALWGTGLDLTAAIARASQLPACLHACLQ
jgi:hypothetical protein